MSKKILTGEKICQSVHMSRFTWTRHHYRTQKEIK